MHCKLNLNIEYAPLFEQLVWNYKKANIESIEKSFELENWKTLFKLSTNKFLSLMKL